MVHELQEVDAKKKITVGKRYTALLDLTLFGKGSFETRYIEYYR
jgi:hypothetical protein